ncbi:Tetratricopeptide repeat-containing protein, putative isoform 1 [Hibiscus syriacus]|uniref:Tetratricopeptide repeat-containing protein, putative isoform 1 n=1 Tax=Hibiscus syriacus TaxID=106335 RepID=A0A6A3AAY3_HIBSY|nr:uncharacterized protein LOC120130152 [Hibiscus syriacus]KAE8701691.1 Tetratricopeptide repeat-containing protein, putative isoform 1 [Hibiscus syriacus]
MDSGNSSLQSSSGDDDHEYDSMRESVPAFLNTSGHFSGALSNPHPSLGSNHHQPPAFSYPWPSYLNNPFSKSQLLHLDGVRPGNLKYDPNCTDHGNLPGFSSPSQLGPQGLNRGSFPSSSSVQTRPSHDNNGVRSSTKNPKKRTRASRRAPTTVLTTDTTNFRAMVQEFTGIPAPPFPGSSSFSRRLDLFCSGSGLQSGHLEPLGSLLRPSARRVQPNPFAPSSSSPSLLNNPLVDAANTITDIRIPSSYQLPSDLGLLKQPQNMLNLQNQSPSLPFQSFLDPSVNMPGFGVKTSHGSSAASLKEIGLTHGQVNANLSGLAAPDAARHENWRDGVGLNQGNQDHLRALDWNYGNSHEEGMDREFK